MTSHTDLIKEKLNILDVVGAYVQLEKAGKTYKGKSPFTNEKTPSFFVSPEKGFFYCFSSGKGGDIFSFIQEIERIDFKDALQLLAQQAGVDIHSGSVEGDKEFGRGLAALDAATRRYEVYLRQHTDVVAYLQDRGLTKESMVAWRLGFAKDSWHDIHHYLRSRKYDEALIAKLGLLSEKDGRRYDRFRKRIMFPLFDAQGRIRGFTGRVFSGDEKGAKYVNSPESMWYDKSSLLYGYHRAKHAIGKHDFCILVEGQFDVILSHQAGYENTLALSGTGLTDQHIALIKRFTHTIYLALDADAAGMKATKRSVISAYRHGMQVKIIALPSGKDPADTIKESKEKWAVALADAKDYLDYRLSQKESIEASFQEKKLLVEDDLFAFISFMQSAVVQDRMLQKIALFLGVEVDAVRKDFAAYEPGEARIAETAQESSSQLQHSLSDLLLARIAYVQEKKGDITPYYAPYTRIYNRDLDADLQALDPTFRDMQSFILEREFENKDISYIIQDIDQLCVREELRHLKEASATLLSRIRQKEAAGDYESARSLMKENQAIREAIETLQVNH